MSKLSLSLSPEGNVTLTSWIVLLLANSTTNLATAVAVGDMVMQDDGLPSLPGAAVWNGSKLDGRFKARLSDYKIIIFENQFGNTDRN